MGDIFSKAENFWKTSKVLPWILVLIGMGLALWVARTGQSPGVAIGILAAVAGVMSVRPPKMHFAEKIAWIVVLVAFTVLEVHSIKVSDKNNENVRNAQNTAFGGIAESLKTSIDTSKTQYTSTITHVDGVLTKTQQVASLAKQSLENITGGNSFAHVTPQVGYSPVPFSIYNDGPNILTGVSVNVRKGLIEADNPDTFDVFGQELEIGTLAPHQLEIVPNFSIRPHPGKSGLDVYVFTIRAQNFEVEERMLFRRSANQKQGEWAYKFNLTRQLIASQKGNTTYFKYQTLMKARWSDGGKDELPPSTQP